MMDNDIVGILTGIKENIDIIESGAYDKSLLDEVRFDFLEFMDLAKLFLISERDIYYGYFLMNMQFSVNFHSNSIAGIKLNEFPPVLEANPLLLCKFSLKEILYIFCHEIDHVLLNHPAEMVKANKQNDPVVAHKFNLAADAAVNDRINYEIKNEKHNFMSEPPGLITSKSLAEMFELNAILPRQHYDYYFKLISKEKKQDDEDFGSSFTLPSGDDNSSDAQNGGQSAMNQEGESQSSSGTGSSGSKNDENSDEQGDGQSAMKQEGESSTEPGASEGSNGENEEENKIVTAKNCRKITDHNWETGDDTEFAESAARELVNASVDMMSEETRGLMPGCFMSEVEKINKPPVISWQSILKRYVGTISADKRKTRSRLNRRQPERFDLSGKIDEKVLKIVVAIDTSGSVSNSMIAKIINEIFAIVAKRKNEVTIIECDSQIQRVYKVKSRSDIKSKVAGRGGTYFTPVIEYINKDRYYRDALLIYFTDGFGENSIPKPLTYRNIWVVIGHAEWLSVDEPYGIVLEL